MIDQRFAEHFVADWIAAWNNHDVDRVLSHYSDNFELASPLIAGVAGEPSGRLRGKGAVGAYWARALTPRSLTVAPELHFKLVNTLVGVDSLAVYYRSTRGWAAEVFEFGADDKVVRAAAHYALRHPSA